MYHMVRFIAFLQRALTFVLALVLIGVGAQRADGQAATANIQGTVTDASGAAIPGAAVQVKNTGTGAVQNAESDAQGRYRVTQLSVGRYEVQISKDGFTTINRTGITLNVGLDSVVDVAMQIGQQTQTVTVEGQASTVETTDATVGTLVDQTQMRELPLNGRNFEQLIQLSTGVQTMGGNSFVASGFQGRAPQYSIAGGRPTGQSILLDDEDLQNFWKKGMGSVTGSSLGVEAIGEFQTLTNTYGARFGGNGAVVNAVSKSGTNNFHGSAYEFLRNNKTDAYNTFAKVGTNPIQPALRQNQFGGSVGGPIKTDKMFFFVNYESIRSTAGDVRIANVPGCNLSPANCTPVFARAANPAGYDAIVNTLSVFPSANLTANGPQALSVANRRATEHYVLSRFDYNITNSDALFVRYISDKSEFREPFGGGAFGGGPIPHWPEQDFSHMHFLTTEWRRILTPTMVNVARASFSRPSTNEFTGETDPAGLVNGTDPLQFFPSSAGRQDGIVNITGLNGIGGALQLPFNTTQNRYTVADDLTWTRGSHTIKIGGSISRLQSNTFMPFFVGSQWNYNSLGDFLGASAHGPYSQPNIVLFVPLTLTTGPQAGQASYPNRDFRQTEITPYFQDDWKVSSKLTLNIGLRLEYLTNPTEKHNQLFIVNDIANATTANAWQNVPTVLRNNPAGRNFNPRFGFAYDPFSDHKTSIRGGFGIFHEPISVHNFAPSFWANYPWAINLGLGFTGIQYPNLPQGGIQTPSSFPGWDWDIGSTPRMMQYNLNIQREIASGTVLTVGYVGSRGIHLLTGQEENPPTVCLASEGPGCANPTYDKGFTAFGPGGEGGYFGFGTPGAVKSNPLRNPALGRFPNLKSNSRSRYNSIQVSVNRRFSSHFQGQANYTFSRCTDDGGYLGSFNTSSTGNVVNPYNRKADYALCSHDVRHSMRVNGLATLPFTGNAFVSGWSLSGIVAANAGLPYEITSGYDESTGGSPVALVPRPDYISGCNAQVGLVNKWFDPSCFTLSAPGTMGNLGRNVGRGPNLVNVDLAVLKDTKIGETLNLQFRAEFFNIFNHANYGLPSGRALFVGGGARNRSAGQITSLVGTPRQIQFALKLTF